jgi:hypothetical protein
VAPERSEWLRLLRTSFVFARSAAFSRSLRLIRCSGLCWPILACACSVYDAGLARYSSTRSEDDAVSSESDGAIEGQSADTRAPGGAGVRSARSCSLGSDSRSPCREPCDETCNGADDDCDGFVDEVESDASCAVAHAGSVCLFGQCILTHCESGYRDCDQRSENGCEVAPDDPNHCGLCGRACQLDHASARCEDGQCRVDACARDYADCDGDRRSCERRTDSARDCGACGADCRLPHMRASCERDECIAGECDAGYADCDDDPTNGCEQALDTLDHCAACGARCDEASCPGGVCTAADCDEASGLADCDADEVRCEVDLRADPHNCGRCGNRCRFEPEITPHAAVGCRAAECRALCVDGYGDCDGDYENGCEQRLDTLAHCGACDRSCSIEDATATCDEGRCEIRECEPSRGDCDGDARSCESRLDRVETCGDCETRCELPHAEARCARSDETYRCEVADCVGHYLDCDRRAANGCEQDGRSLREGGAGPCSPDEHCRRATRDERQYFICSTARSWSDARSHCLRQRGGDLLVLDDAGELDFIRDRISTQHWIGHTDAEIEQLWVWARTQVPFWTGGVRGIPIEGRFAPWDWDEPNDSGDCGALMETGRLHDRTCERAQPFVCEVMPDLCPDNPDKLDPGQCGCASPDTDADSDGFAECD